MRHNKLFRLKDTDEKCILRSTECTSYSFNLNSGESKCKYRLFFSCEDAFLPLVKNEGGGDQLYMLIDDSLDYDNAGKSRYCLNFSCEKPTYATKRAVKKIMWKPLVYGLFGLNVTMPRLYRFQTIILPYRENRCKSSLLLHRVKLRNMLSILEKKVLLNNSK